jgi:prepilin-type processing-associated H-X9-DG protein
VVIAIIAILAAILFPVFSRAREKARQTNCLSNTKQIMLGVQMYSQDYDEMLVSQYYGAGPDYTYRSAILPYVKNAQIFQCPSKRMGNTFSGGLDYGANGGYGVNAVHYAANAPTPPPGQSDGDVQYPATCIFLGETEGSEAFANTNGTNAHNDTTWVSTANSRHNGTSNFGFCDGHAKALPPTKVSCATGNCQFDINGG